MTRRIRSTSMVLAAAAVLVASSSTSAFAAPIHMPKAVHAFFKAKAVNLTLKNTSAAPITVSAGANTVTVAPGSTASLAVMPGEKVTRDGATLLSGVDSSLNGAIITLK